MQRLVEDGRVVGFSGLRPELVSGLAVVRMEPNLPELPVLDVGDQHVMSLKGLPPALPARSLKPNGVLVVRDDVVQLRPKRSTGQLEQLAEVAEQLLLPPGYDR